MTLRWAGLWVVVGALAGCGGAVPPQAPPPGAADDTREPATIDEAQAQLDAARSRLEGRPALKGVGGAPAGGNAPTTDQDAAASRGEEASTADACATSCRAIASMRRAVAAICRMAGETDARCTDAKRVLDENEKRVVRCGCR